MPRTTRILYDSAWHKRDDDGERYASSIATNVLDANSPEGYRYGNCLNERWGARWKVTTGHGTAATLTLTPSGGYDGGNITNLSFAMFDHNFYSASATGRKIEVWSSTSSDFVADGTRRLLIDSGIPSSNSDGFWFSTQTLDTSHYLEVRFYFDSSGASGPDEEFYVGQVIVGSGVELEAQHAPRQPMRGSRVYASRIGHRSYPFTWDTGKMTQANWETLVDIFDTVGGPAVGGPGHPFALYSHRENDWVTAGVGEEDPDGTPANLQAGTPWWCQMDGEAITETEVSLGKFRASVPLVRTMNRGQR